MKWLSRNLSPPSPFLTLATSQRQFNAILRHLSIPEPYADWLGDGAIARTHTFVSEGGETTCVITIDPKTHSDFSAIETLIHEAVHVWQQHCDNIGEANPGDEQEAYAIQFIASTLIKEYARRTKSKGTGL